MTLNLIISKKIDNEVNYFPSFGGGRGRLSYLLT